MAIKHHSNENFLDNNKLTFGTSDDLQLYHDGSNSYINDAGTGDLLLRRGLAGGLNITGTGVLVNGDLTVNDNKKLIAGNADDLQIYHNGTTSNNNIENHTGGLYVTQYVDDGDIIFRSDNGSGGVETYFFLDGSTGYTLFPDGKILGFGAAGDLSLQHDGSNSYINANGTGDLIIKQMTDDKDIILQSDDQSGGVATYFYLDGSVGFNRFPYPVIVEDSVNFNLGTGQDMQLLHNGSDSVIRNATGDLYIQQNANDKDIILQSDDGSGGTTAYITLDGSAGHTIANKEINFPDGINATFGNATNGDLRIHHTSGESVIHNTVGHFGIGNLADDKDLILQCDDGSGGTAAYITLDGGNADIDFSKPAHFLDNVNVKIGSASGGDLQIYHNGAHSLISNQTGSLFIRNQTNDGDIVFQADDGSGGDTTYLTLDGGETKINVSCANGMQFDDNVRIKVGGGTGGDLRIYHDGSNSYISDTGTGSLVVQSSDLFLRTNSTENAIVCAANASVTLYYDNSAKLATTSSGVKTTYSATSNTDGDVAGDIVHLGETTTVAGKIYYYKSDGAWGLVDADAASTCSGLLAVALGTSSNTNGMLLRGMATIANDPGAVGDTLFASTTAGQATATAPSGSGDIVRVIGYCLNASNGQIWFNPDGAFVEVA